MVDWRVNVVELSEMNRLRPTYRSWVTTVVSTVLTINMSQRSTNLDQYLRLTAKKSPNDQVSMGVTVVMTSCG